MQYGGDPHSTKCSQLACQVLYHPDLEGGRSSRGSMVVRGCLDAQVHAIPHTDLVPIFFSSLLGPKGAGW